MTTLSEQEASSSGRVWTVSEINRAVKAILEDHFPPFWLRGEIGNITIHRSGHVYFTLKDTCGQIPAVFFRGAQTARRLQLATGVEVEVHGRLTVYEPRGAYQVVVHLIRPRGIGDLQERYERLRAKLREEGLFDDERKRPIPRFPRCVGLVTSPEGAAVRDFLHIVSQRFAGLHVRLVPTPVQGRDAAPGIADAIRLLCDHAACDVIVVTRGGGSLEDLWAFNEEIVARAVAASSIPVVSAVGHERDFTICDYAADVRVPTPSAAAERVIAAKSDVLEQVVRSRRALYQGLSLRLSRSRERLQRALASRVFHEPSAAVRSHQQRVDELSLRLSQALRQQSERARGRFQQASTKLAMLDPKGVLARGYSILMDKDGKAVRRAGDTEAGARLYGILSAGRLTLDVVSAMPADGAPPDNVDSKRIET